MADVENTADMVQAVKQRLGEELSEEQVHAVLAAWNSVRAQGDPVGMVRRDEESGKVAHRVVVEAVEQWRVSGADGDQYNDLQPTLPWPVLFDPR
ncbi:hypothetical protein TM4_24 [Mycobacterium phage TM4]|uniref:Uncharacterized protein n=1 Tax=Mycobacterium phage TM4 TaxID=88870 RepID=Q9ZX53_BPMT4|nr:hypothetical protein TM4_gp24 [Mycobacterium phage TM4]AAD17592.1 hypothetical protein TM4_24 [Mycobacterium phage TM4]